MPKHATREVEKRRSGGAKRRQLQAVAAAAAHRVASPCLRLEVIPDLLLLLRLFHLWGCPQRP